MINTAISYAVTVTDVPTVAAPVRGVANLRAFTPGDYAAGDLFLVGSQTYLVTTSGEYTVAPTHRRGLVGGLLATPHARRKALVLQNTGSAPLFVAFGDPVTAATGIQLNAGASMSLTAVQAGVGAVTSSGSSTLRVAEIFV